jgi:hypothetical protein
VFVDPPYFGDRHYCARVDDYASLARWCRSRRGPVSVCEQGDADWLPFRPFRIAKSIARGAYNEVAWAQRDTTRRSACLQPSQLPRCSKWIDDEA